MMIAVILVVGALCIACFFVGAWVGTRVSKGEDIEMPSISPLKAHREREARKEAQRAQERVDTILQNIDNYDGTAQGQKDVPRG